MKKICKKEIYNKIKNLKGLWFHIIGLACMIWFIIRVLPAPYRYQYPCQQISIPIALGYITFWSVLFHGFSIWIRKIKIKTATAIPAILIFFIIAFSINGMVFADNYNQNNNNTAIWTPITKDPIGTPFGANPGRVVWVYNPDATEEDLTGYWWESINNNQTVIEQMLSSGIKKLAGKEDEYSAWATLFQYFNQIKGRGNFSYQPGEKIAIKMNLNNCYGSYRSEDNDRDASPYVIKALLKSLIDTVGVEQEDITLYDATRPIQDWIYNRVYYETYPSSTLITEYPDINFKDVEGGATGRERVIASTEKIYFADNTDLYRTLPICVAEADYIINMPLLKRHPLNNGNGVTLSGKNMFGTWVEDVAPIHTYHESGRILGNTAPQTDLLAHEEIGGKTFLYLGDGTYGTLRDHRTIGKFQMYPFNNDWTNSLFLSQDPVAIDSVMYDFLYSEGTNPSEGSQNYLHQAAEPPINTYDPEEDGEYLTNSLGVHEHWDTSFDIFSSERYSGPSENGIDYKAIKYESTSPDINILTPKNNRLYVAGNEFINTPITIIIGNINIEVEVTGITEEIEKIEFYIDNNLKTTDYEQPYIWLWDETSFGPHTINVKAFYNTTENIEEQLNLWKFF